MIVIDNERQLAELFQRLREYNGISRDQLARRVHADRRTVDGRETGRQGYTTRALIDTAAAFGYRVALIAVDDRSHEQAA